MTSESENRGAGRKEASSVLERFVIFTDEPLFTGDQVSDRDAFNHEAFAETILKLLVRNKPPLSIGLFGSWGIGKSTIINILRRKIRQRHNDKLKDIYFNAWKYSGDSFRRQFLIEVARQIYGENHDEVRRIRQLNYSEVLKKSHQQNLSASIAQALRDAFSVKFAFRGNAVARMIIGCASVLFCVALGSLVSRWSPSIATFLLAISIPAIFVWFSGMKFDEVFVLHEEPIYDPKLIFPEQFEEEFKLLAESSALCGRNLVIAIDDIDRCEPAVIKDILISAKNFIGHGNCFFIVPCDDKTVVDIFTEPSQKEGYRDESLRKYFNVTLRIPPITSTDLVDFANTVARQTCIPDDIVQFAVLANCRDARKMKHFLNSLEMKYQVAKAREAAGLMPAIVDANLPELAKVVLIENSYPQLFSRLVENPRIFELLEKAALETLAPRELETYGLGEWGTDYPGLREVLERTQEIKMAHADVFFPLKSTNTEVRIPRGTELKTAITEGNSKLIDEIASGIVEADARVATADLVLDLLDRSAAGPFLRNAISAALGLWSSDSFFPSNERVRVGRGLLRALIRKDRAGVLSQAPSRLLQCAKESVDNYLTPVLDAYYSAIERLTQPLPENLGAIVLALYEFSPDRGRFAGLLNGRLVLWADTPEGLSLLDELGELGKLPEGEKIPDVLVVAKVLKTLDSEQFVEGDVIRRKVLFANWSEEVAEAFIQILTSRMQGSTLDGVYAPVVEFVISSILLQPQLVESDAAAQLWAFLKPLFDNLKDARGKVEVARASVVFASRSRDAEVSTPARDFVLQVWRSASDSLLREELEFAGSLDTPRAQELFKLGVEQELSSVRREIQQPTDRTIQRVALCFDYRTSLEAGSLEGVLIETLDAKSAETLGRWIEVIEQRRAALGSDFANGFAIRCLEIVPSIPKQGERQELLLQAVLDVFPGLSADEKHMVLREYFSLMKDPQEGTRSVAASTMKGLREASSENQDFKLAVANVIKYLRDEVKTAELTEYGAVFNALLTEAGPLGEYQNRDLADMAKALMSESDESLQELGLQIVDQMPVIPNDDQSEVIHLLIGIAGSSPSLRERAVDRLGRFSLGKVVDGARQELQGWLNPGA